MTFRAFFFEEASVCLGTDNFDRPAAELPIVGAGPRRSWRVACLATTAALFMTGISSASLQSSSSASQLSRHTAVAKVTAPSVVNLAFTADMGVPDPDIFYSVEGNVVITSVYEGLVQYANNSATIVPALATSWTISPNGLTYTFQLRPHVMFHDGAGPMTSTDVEASFRRRAALGATSPPGYMVADIASYGTPSPLVFVVHLKTPLAPFMDELAAPYGPRSRTLPAWRPMPAKTWTRPTSRPMISGPDRTRSPSSCPASTTP